MCKKNLNRNQGVEPYKDSSLCIREIYIYSNENTIKIRGDCIMSIWKKKASDLTVEEITLLSLGLGVGVGAVTYVYKETDWFETVGRKISELWHKITKK